MREKRDMRKKRSLENNILFPTNWKNENCWYWIGKSGSKKYPYIEVTVAGEKTQITVRRLMWETNIVDNNERPLKKSDIIISICKSDICVNPSHLVRYTKTQGLDLGYLPQSRIAREKFAKITHCPHGHEYTSENTRYVKPKKWWDNNSLNPRLYAGRKCRTCDRERAYAKYRKKGSTHLARDYDKGGLLSLEVMDMDFKRPPRNV